MKRPGFIAESILKSRYQAGNTLLHSMPPGAKLALAFSMIVLISTGHGLVLLASALLCGLGARLAGLSFYTLWGLIKSFRWFLFMIMLFPLVFTPGPPIPGLDFLPFDISREGAVLGGESAARLLLMFVVSMVLMRTTAPMQIIQSIQALVILKSPVWKTRIQNFFLIGVWAVQLIPHLCVEAERFFFDHLESRPGQKRRGGLSKAWQAAQLLAPMVVQILNGLDRYMEVLVTGDELGGPKPQPRPETA